MVRMRLQTATALAVVGWLAVPGITAAQVQAGAGDDAFRFPALSVGGGMGAMQFLGRTVPIASGIVQIGIGRHLVIAPEVARWVQTDAPGLQFDGTRVFETRRRAVAIVGTHVLFRSGTTRLTGVVGGAPSAQFVQDRFEHPVDPRSGAPVEGPPATRTGIDFGLMAVGGVDVRIAPRLVAFAMVRGDVRPDLNVGLTTGVRWIVKGGAAAPADFAAPRRTARVSLRGEPVEILRTDGREVSGRLVTFSPHDVVIVSRGAGVRIPIEDVRRLRRPSHWARNLALVGAGVFAALAAGYCTVDCGSEGLAMLAIEGAIATGAGLGIGAMIDAATSPRRTIYP